VLQKAVMAPFLYSFTAVKPFYSWKKYQEKLGKATKSCKIYPFYGFLQFLKFYKDSYNFLQFFQASMLKFLKIDKFPQNAAHYKAFGPIKHLFCVNIKLSQILKSGNFCDLNI
jgi:hypothetical protein